MNVFLGLGSNIGNRKANIVLALSILQSSGFVSIKDFSSFYETSPIGPKQRNFYNICIRADTLLEPLKLLDLIKDIENLMGRKKAKKWTARIIDIDILFFGNKIVKNDRLNIPHKEIKNRLFVLIPLSEIAPNLLFPNSNKKIKDILKDKLLTLNCQKIKIAPRS
ncbi:MAG: 2-amino-4-hydroxy-6-hydroxymethyldihydropteridine diphosphokinase [Elusimicrobiota bacterium]|jgi:2-amino-4-hydroxy-6-hydroxymethyldihydropteridine diphosphokinase|nr:2-amino-4-hydroxy-6-hydroxymethyldihydropteridine diphosphokinase [Elusimicrobiota bacterium]